jgi:hypothetical protein
VIQSDKKKVCFILKRKKGVGFCLFGGKRKFSGCLMELKVAFH